MLNTVIYMLTVVQGATSSLILSWRSHSAEAHRPRLKTRSVGAFWWWPLCGTSLFAGFPHKWSHFDSHIGLESTCLAWPAPLNLREKPGLGSVCLSEDFLLFSGSSVQEDVLWPRLMWVGRVDRRRWIEFILPPSTPDLWAPLKSLRKEKYEDAHTVDKILKILFHQKGTYYPTCQCYVGQVDYWTYQLTKEI